jgi:hypothetical protein
MQKYRKSPVAAREVGTTYVGLFNLIRHGKIAAPEKDSSGDYIWTEQNLAAARQALEARRQRRAKV